MKRSTIMILGAAVAFLALGTTPAAAQADGPSAAVQAALDNAWVLLAGMLVFCMQVGFTLLESGMTRVKNATNILAKNLADISVGALAFVAVGYALAFGGDNLLWGTEGFFLVGETLTGAGSSGYGNLSTATFLFFQLVFAATAVTIASGAMVERTRFSAYLIFSAVTTAVIYPTVVHWIWGGGLIADLEIGAARFSDFAGSTVVHGTGGWAALTGALFLGPRLGKYTADGVSRPIAGHAVPMVVLGTFILWLGWFGFNAGSLLAFGDEGTAARVILNTALAGAAGTVAGSLVVWRRIGLPDMSIIPNGTLAGLVSVTAGCATMDPIGAVLVAAVAGPIAVFSMTFFERRGLDDPVGAVSVHAVAGVWGTLAVGLFARHDDGFLGRENAGLLYGGGGGQLAVQLIGVALVAVWVLATTGLLFGLMRRFGWLRVSAHEEALGLDLTEHGSAAYPADVLPRDARAYDTGTGAELPGGGPPASGAGPDQPGSPRR